MAQFHYSADGVTPFCRTFKWRGRLLQGWDGVDCGSCQHVRQFRRDQPIKPTPKPCFVYLITASDDKEPLFAKVGISNNVEQRLMQLDQGPLFLDIRESKEYPSEPAARAVEQQIHRELGGRFNGEWFRWAAGRPLTIFKAVIQSTSSKEAK